MVRRYPPRIMADPSPTPTVLLPEAEVARIVADLARRIAPVIDDDTVAAVLLTGGLWFAADLTRALSRVGRNAAGDGPGAAFGHGARRGGPEQRRADRRAARGGGGQGAW